MATQLLNDITIRNAKPGEKDKRLNDGGGLYVLIKPTGAKWWRFDYTIDGKRKTLSMGVYPKLTLSEARGKARAAANKVANNIISSRYWAAWRSAKLNPPMCWPHLSRS
jgi:hypothetical protein